MRTAQRHDYKEGVCGGQFCKPTTTNIKMQRRRDGNFYLKSYVKDAVIVRYFLLCLVGGKQLEQGACFEI